MEIKREHQFNFLYIVAAFIAVLLIQQLLWGNAHIKTIPYSEFQQLVDQGKVSDLVIGPDRITGKLRDEGRAGGPTAAQHDLAYNHHIHGHRPSHSRSGPAGAR